MEPKPDYTPNSGYPDLRDYFASQALNGMLASDNDGNSGVVFDHQLARRAGVYARLAYELADAMMAERMKTEKR